jgi:hypothetical protein
MGLGASMHRKLVATSILAIGALLLGVSSTFAQTTRPLEFSAQATGLTAISPNPRPIGSRTVTPGLAGRIDVSVLPRISFEARIAFYPQRLVPDADQGGRAFETLGGVRATFIEKGRVAIHGEALAGAVHFSNTLRDIDAPDGPATRFVLFMGGDLSVNLSRRVFVTTSADIRLTRVPGSITCFDYPDHASICGAAAAQVTPPWEFGAGVGVRLGTPAATPRIQSAVAKRLTVGGQAAYRIAADRFGPVDLHESAGATAFASYQVKRGLDLEASFATFAQRAADALIGGRMNHAAVGLKTGFRSERAGAFIQLLGGVNSYTNGANENTIYSTHIDLATGIVTHGSQTYGSRFEPAFDIGGVLELYLRQRWTIRFDASDSVALFKEISLGATPSSDSMRFAAGLGWRF